MLLWCLCPLFPAWSKNQRVNHTRCCLSFLTPQPRPSDVRRTVSRGSEWIASLAGWSSDGWKKSLSSIFSPRRRPCGSKWSLLALATPGTTLILVTKGRRRNHAVLRCFWEMGSRSPTSVTAFTPFHSGSRSPCAAPVLIKSCRIWYRSARAKVSDCTQKLPLTPCSAFQATMHADLRVNIGGGRWK